MRKHLTWITGEDCIWLWRLRRDSKYPPRIEVWFQSKLWSNWVSKLNISSKQTYHGHVMKYLCGSVCPSTLNTQTVWNCPGLPCGGVYSPVGPGPATSTVPHGWCSGWHRPPRTAPCRLQFMGCTPWNKHKPCYDVRVGRVPSSKTDRFSWRALVWRLKMQKITIPCLGKPNFKTSQIEAPPAISMDPMFDSMRLTSCKWVSTI